jgi:siroheme synthase (precorrin-2 oxidase/ferrochelatase)
MGSIVTKGDLKIAISTNGKSPTFAKRFRQLLEQILPDNIEELLPNLQQLRNKLQLSFSEKVSYLNEVTKSLIEENK